MDTGPVLALEPLSTIMPGKSVPAFSSRGEATDTPALCSIYFSFLFMVQTRRGPDTARLARLDPRRGIEKTDRETATDFLLHLCESGWNFGV